VSTNNSIDPFSQAPLNLNFEGRRVRFVGTADKPEWIAQDACDAIGIDNVSRALADFEEDEKGIRILHTLGGKQKLLTVYESGLYRLLLTKSKKPEAKRFQKWVFGEVLPSIRKYGIYPPPENFAYEITLKPYTARVVWVMQVRQRLPKGYRCVFIEGAELLIGAEVILKPAELEMHQYDLLDGSIGRHWSIFRQDKPWMGMRRSYEYTFPQGDPRGTVTPACYPMQELEHFKTWLHGDYWVRLFPEYIKRKYGVSEFQRALPIFAKMGVPLLADKPK
jgi:prophage antirepressor-like protein